MKACQLCGRSFLTWWGKARHAECGTLKNFPNLAGWYRQNARLESFLSRRPR